MRVLVVGAGGFVGGFACEEGLRRGYEVYAGVRETTSRKYLTDPALKFVTIDFDSEESIAASLRAALPEGEKWDYIIYNLGATKAPNFADFNRVNYEYIRRFTEALKKTAMVPEKLLYMSSLSVMGPGDEKGYTPFTTTMVPRPNTKYGASKLKAEMWLTTAGIPYIIFRATGIYGPRETDYFLMFKYIQKGWDFSVGYRKQMLTFIYVEDLCRAMYDALEKAPTGKTYIISEDRGYTQDEFRKISAEALGKKHVIPVRVPLVGLKLVSTIAEKIAVAKMQASTLNRDKYNIMKQRNWNADISAAEGDFGFHPETDLATGVRKAVEWYKKEGWLK